MNNLEYPPMTYNELASFIKQRLWNNKTITLEITRDSVEDHIIKLKLIKNERNNTK